MLSASSSTSDLFNFQTLSEIQSLQARCQKSNSTLKIGITASCFDCLHAGHVKMLDDAKKQCDFLVIALQTDPTIDRPHKNKPVQSFEERQIMIQAVRHVDQVIKYATESDFYQILIHLQPDIRILGSDYENKSFTGDDLKEIPIYYHDRNHNWSSTDFRRRIYEAEKSKLNLTLKNSF